MELAYAAAELVHADDDRKKALRFRYTKVDLDEADEDARDSERVDMDWDGPSAPKRRRLSPRPDGMEVDEDLMVTTLPALRLRRTIAPLSQPVDDEDEGDEDDEDDEDDDEDEDDCASVHSIVRQTPASASTAVAQQPSANGTATSAGPTPAELIGEMERNSNQSELDLTLKSAADIGRSSTGVAAFASQIPAGSEVDGDGEPLDEDMDAEGEADDENGNGARSAASTETPIGPSQPSVIFKAEEKAQLDIEVPPRDESSGRQSQSVTGVGGNKKGLKAGHEDVAVSSVAGSLLDPKLLRGPILDLGLEEFVVDLCDLFNQGLAIEDQVSDPDKDDITLASLFPELPLYDFTEPPQSEVNGKKDKRIDESGMSSGRLTYTARLMDSKNLLLSTLQPGTKYRQGRWDDPSDIPVAEEPRDYSKSFAEIVPPAAREFPFQATAVLTECERLLPAMFCGTKARDHIHPIHTPNLVDPHDTEYRLIQFVWTNEEDQLLKALYNQFGQNWQLIADVFNSSRITISTDIRAAWDCLKRWKALQGEDKTVDGNSSKPDTPDMYISGATTTRHNAAVKAAAAAAPTKKLPVQIAAARAAGGRRPMRHSIVFEVIKKLINKRAAKPPGAVT
jgi:chromatin modification-related protein VID21